MDIEKIKKAFDDFENDDFVAAKETLSGEVKKKVADHLRGKLELKSDSKDDSEDDTKGDKGDD